MLCKKCHSEFSFFPNKPQDYCPKCDSYLNNYAPLKVVWEHGLCGFCNDKAEMLTPIKYDYCTGYAINSFYEVRLKGKSTLIDELGREVFPFKYDSIFCTTDNLCIVSLNHKHGIVDLRDQVIVPLEYQLVRAFSDDLAAVCKNYKFGFVNRKGQLVIDSVYEYADSFHEGLAQVQLDGMFGFIDTLGKIIIDCKYESAGNFHEGLAAVELNGLFGYIDTFGNECIPFEYENAECFKFGLAIVENDDCFGAIDRLNNEIIPTIYDSLEQLSNGLIAAKYGDWSGVLNNKGEKVTVPKKAEDHIFDSHIRFNYNIADSVNDFIEKNFGFFEQQQFDEVFDSSNGLYIVNKNRNSKWGYIDDKCNVVIPVIYDFINHFHDSYTSARLNGKFGIIDKQNNTIIPFEYDDAFFYSNTVQVNKNGLHGCVDFNNQVLIPLIYDSIDILDEYGQILVEKNGKFGFVDWKGNEIIPLIYDEVYDEGFSSDNGTCYVSQEETWYMIDRTGRQIKTVETPEIIDDEEHDDEVIECPF